MSIVSSLVLVLLCFSFHAYNARTLGVVNKDQAERIEQHSTSQKNETLNPNRVSIQPGHTKFSATDSSESEKNESINEEKKGNTKFNNPGKDIRTTNNQVKVSDTTRVEPRESVMWKVPHKERRDPEVPGFNLDYLPPRTHPPVHN